MNLRVLLVLFSPTILASTLWAEAVRSEAVVADAVTRNPELAFYEAELAAARAARSAAGARAEPEIAVEMGRKRVHDFGGTLAGEGMAWSVSLSQTFEWPGRLALRKAIANRDVALAELGVARFRAAVRARALMLAYGVMAEQRKAAAVREVAGRFRALKELFLARDPAGLTPLLETRVIEAQELAMQRRATGAELKVKSALAELNQLRGAPIEEELEIAPTGLVFSDVPPLEQLIQSARENHFEFRARGLELEQQGFVVQLARNERRPSVTLSPFVAQESAGDRERIVGLGLSMPLPVTARTRGAVEAAEARRRQAEAAVQMAQREMEREVAAATRAFAAQRAEMSRWAPASAEKFREAAELADRHYRLGAVPIGTYVELQSAYLEAVESLLDTQQEALAAAVQLQLLTGWATPFVAQDAATTP